MNNKGFTLVELLATIVILSLITSITVVTVTSMYSNSKDNAEKIFKQELANIITDYITIYNNKFSFSCDASTGICTATKYKNNVKINGSNRTSSDDIKLKDLVDAELISNKDIINPKDKGADCNLNSKITVYRNNNYVYRFETENINCLTGTGDDKKIITKFPT